MNSYYEAFIKRLSQYRIQLNLTQEKASQALGITQSQLSKQELGRTIVPYKVLVRYSDMGWDIDYLFTGIRSERKASALAERIDRAEAGSRLPLLKLAVWALETGIARKCSEISMETKCEIDILRARAESETNQTTLYEIRKIAGMPQLAMAEKLGVNIKKYRALEREETHPDAELLTEIYVMTGCKPSLFLTSGDTTSMIIDDLWSLLPAEQQIQIMAIMDQAEEFLGA